MSETTATDEDTFSLALYGASGALGRQLTEALEGEGLPISDFFAAGALHSAGGEVAFRGQSIPIRTAGEVDALEPDVAILAVPADVAEQRRERLMRAGTLVVDLSAAGRRNSSMPLIWPALNVEALASHEGGFAVPGPLTTTVAPIAAALARVGKLDAIDVVAMLSAGHCGQRGPADLSAQTLALMNFRVPDAGSLGGEQAFNVLIGSREADADGDSFEQELRWELPRLSPDFSDTQCHLTAVRIPVFSGLAATVTARFAAGVELEKSRLEAALRARGDLEDGGLDISLRDAMDSDTVLWGPMHVDAAQRVVRVTAFADPAHRVASAVAGLLDRMQRSDDLW